jgi:hypothetical protein
MKNRYSFSKTIIIIYLILNGMLIPPHIDSLHASDIGFASLEKIEVKNLDNSLPEAHQLALKRINQYRLAMNLPAWEYDSSLSKMAQAHADYVLINCNLGRGSGGHSEDPSYPGYTKEGHEAASTSGLSGGPDPLYGLERLIEGPYHRLQFMSKDRMRVGIGFTYDTKSFCGSTLFVSRPFNAEAESANHRNSNEEYILFPPNGFRDNLTIFYSEWPDPRPVKRQDASGYIASILLSAEQILKLVDTKSTLKDSKGRSIPIWETNPTKPTHKNSPPGMDLSQANYFDKNFGMVFIMPKEQLKPDEQYTIRSKIIYKNSEEIVEWSFSTRGNQNWNLSPTQDRLNSKHFRFVMNHITENDVLYLENGQYFFDQPIWLEKSVSLIGKDKTYIKSKPNSIKNEYLLNFHKGGNFRIENLILEDEKFGLIYVDSNTNLSISHSIFKNNPGTTFQFNHGSKIHAESSSFVNLGSPQGNPFCLRGDKPNLKDAELILEDNNLFSNIQTAPSSCGAFLKKKSKNWVIESPKEGEISLVDALNLAGNGEEIVLKKGNHDFSVGKWIGERKLKITGEDGSRIVNETADAVFQLFKKADLELENIELIGKCSFFAVRPQTKLNLANISTTTTGNDCFFGTLEGNGIIEITNSNFENYASKYFIYSHSAEGKINIDANTKFPTAEPKYNPISGVKPKK